MAWIPPIVSNTTPFSLSQDFYMALLFISLSLFGLSIHMLVSDDEPVMHASSDTVPETFKPVSLFDDQIKKKMFRQQQKDWISCAVCNLQLKDPNTREDKKGR